MITVALSRMDMSSHNQERVSDKISKGTNTRSSVRSSVEAKIICRLMMASYCMVHNYVKNGNPRIFYARAIWI